MLYCWIILYGATYLLGQALSALLRLRVTPLAMLVYSSGLLLWLRHTGQHRSFLLCRPKQFVRKELPSLLLLLALPVCNLLRASSSFPTIGTAVLMAAACFTEEVFFRGFLLRKCLPLGLLSGSLLSGLCFALCHSTNLLQNRDIGHLTMQMLCAFAVGWCLCMLTVRCGSILPGMGVHFAINVTGATQPEYTSGPDSIGLWLCILCYILCGIWLYHRNNKEILE